MHVIQTYTCLVGAGAGREAGGALGPQGHVRRARRGDGPKGQHAASEYTHEHATLHTLFLSEESVRSMFNYLLIEKFEKLGDFVGEKVTVKRTQNSPRCSVLRFVYT